MIFITGNSRSGTTMMMRIMGGNSQVHTINEPHFFDGLWSPNDRGKSIDRTEASQLLSKLLVRQRIGFDADPEVQGAQYSGERASILDNLYSGGVVERLDVYAAFMRHEASANGARVVCEKTPQNIFYIEEILRFFPNARIVNMIRDPRATMLSQKRKWKRKALGADFMTDREMKRLKANYHPITMSKLWNSALRESKRWKHESRYINLRYEDLRNKPQEAIQRVCEHAGISYEAQMLDIPHAGSSLAADEPGKRGIRKVEQKDWKTRGLDSAELYWCQKMCRDGMQRHDYPTVEHHAGAAEIFASALAFPYKVVLALWHNRGRMRSLSDTLRRRLQRR